MKKKKVVKISIISIIVIVIGVSIFAICSNNLSNEKVYTSYTQELVYDNVNHKIEGKQTVCYINDTDNVLNELMLHLYPNAFRKDALASVTSIANMEKTYPNGKSYGNIQIESVSCGEKYVEYEICGEDENILKINLDYDLYPNDTYTFEIGFTSTLPNANHRYGYGKNTINICNYYPIMCVYEDGNFVQDLYNSNGDPFYSKIANYMVTITYDQSLTLASTGSQNTTINNDKKITTINANKVRDFAMVMSDKFKVMEDNFEDTKILYYYYNCLTPEKSVNVIKQLLKMNQRYADYPYSTISVAESNFVHGGMEYPNLVLIADDLNDELTYINVIVHELCHQWWYGVVGNNQYKYAFLDEGLTDFNTALFYDEYPEYNFTSEEIFSNAKKSYCNFINMYKCVYNGFSPKMNRAINEFDTETEYTYMAYVKGMLMFSNLQDTLGKNKMTKCLKYYYDCNKYSEATPNDLILAFNKASGKNLTPIFNSWLNGNVVIMSVK